MGTTKQGKPKGSSTGSGRAKRRQGLRKSTKEEPREDYKSQEDKEMMRTNNAGKFMMLENTEHDCRYEFFTKPVMVSNVDNRVAYYEPIVRYCKKLSGGSTYLDDRTSVEEGNKLFKALLQRGFERVTERSFA